MTLPSGRCSARCHLQIDRACYKTGHVDLFDHISDAQVWCACLAAESSVHRVAHHQRVRRGLSSSPASLSDERGYCMDMDQGVRGWIVITARKNFWRVSSYYELDDLVQDGFLHFCRLRRRYPKVRDRAQMMALFKRTYLNHINDLSNRKTRSVERIASSLDQLMELAEHPNEFGQILKHPSAMICLGDCDWAEFLAATPKRFRGILDMLVRSSEGPRMLWGPYRVRRGGTRETTQERIFRLFKLDAGSEIFEELRSYLHSV